MTTTWPDSNTFWRDKRVIVIGDAGFLGSFVVEKLRERGADVQNIDGRSCPMSLNNNRWGSADRL